MILVDPRMLEQRQVAYNPPDTLRDNLRDLDEQMNLVLERKDVDAREKARLYQRTLRRYMTRLDQYKERPLGAVNVKQPIKELPAVLKDEVVEKTHQSPLEEPANKTEEPIVTSPTVVKEPPKASYKLRRKKTKSGIPRWEEWGKK